MTAAHLLLGIFASQVLFVFTKLLFINVLNIESVIIRYVMWIVLSIITIAIVRRMGVLNYLENIFLIAVWFIVSLVTDLVITTSFTGRDVYKTWYFWIAYLVILISMFVFHKKSHVEIRKMQAEANK